MKKPACVSEHLRTLYRIFSYTHRPFWDQAWSARPGGTLQAGSSGGVPGGHTGLILKVVPSPPALSPAYPPAGWVDRSFWPRAANGPPGADV